MTKDEALKLALDFLLSRRMGAEELIVEIQEALAQPAQKPTDIVALVEGMEVSIDVSTGEHDARHRLFGTVTLAQENQGSKHGLILLVQEPTPNFKVSLVQEPDIYPEEARDMGLEAVAYYTTPPAAPVPCCGKYETCTQACTPRGKFLGAREAEIHVYPEFEKAFECFANLIRADEREACAKVCETGVDYEHPTVKGHIMENFGHSRLLAKAIRARGDK
jgi:hypothetical protein